ncbi:MAG: hypothetical protein ACXAEU_11425 [Candidatus Hodarchaeales archaeon]|jgi:hypothetical protein
MNIKKLSIGLILFLAVTVNLFGNQGIHYGVAQDGTEKKVVLIDEGHGQFFNRSAFSSAIAAIEDTGNAIIHSSTKNLEDEVLAGVDLLIITNPGSNSETIFTDVEKKAIGNWVKTGGKSLFLLCNPYDADNSSLTGNPIPLNSLITTSHLLVSDTRFYEESIARSSNVIRNGTELDRPAAVLELLDLEIANTTLQLINSSYTSLSILSRSSSVDTKQKIVFSGYDTYSIGQSGFPDLQEENPSLFGISLADKGSKIALSGSSLMFSDLPRTTGEKWFDSQDNDVFFKEVINWLLGVTISPKPEVLDWALTVPVSIGIVGIVVTIIGTVFPKPATPDSKERTIETPIIEVPSNIEEETQVPSTGLSKRQRKFAQRKKASQKHNKKGRGK